MSDLLIRYDEPIAEYHADKTHIGSTDLKLACHSPATFHDRVELGNSAAESDSPALAVGRLWHTLRELGDDQFGDRATIVPSQFTTAGGEVSSKAEAKAWVAEAVAAGKIVLTQAQSDTLGRMREGFEANSAAVDLEESIEQREVSVRWTGPHDILLKCRPDAICAGGVLLDWKSTREKYPLETFCLSVRTFEYGLSAALYEQGCAVAGLATPPMHFVVSSTVEPWETQVIVLPSAYMDWCRKRLDMVLEDIARRRRECDWLPVGYGEVVEIRMPGFGDRSVLTGSYTE